jgi:hypothetical protein
MSHLILNSFPVEITPRILTLPFAEYDDWQTSTIGRNRDYKEYYTYRYDRTQANETDVPPGKRIRMLLLSGPPPSPEHGTHDVDLGVFPALGGHLIDQTLSRYLASQGMRVRRTSFESLALARVEGSSTSLIHLYSGISFQARRPFVSEQYSFVVSVQWVARAVFADSLVNSALNSISVGLAVLYTPKVRPIAGLEDFQNHYLGHVKQIGHPSEAIVDCRDGETRSLPLMDLTLEASPEAIRRYEQQHGSIESPTRIWRKVQQLSKVFTKEGRRNPNVLRDRLEAIRGLLGGRSREQLVLPLQSYVTGTVNLGLAPLRVEIPT